MKTLTLTLIAGTTAIGAVEDLAQPAFGLQLGLGRILPQDERFEGSTVSLYLYLNPTSAVDVGLLHEEMYIGTGSIGTSSGGGGEGGEGGGNSEGGERELDRGHYDALRARYRIFDDEIQSARVLISAGWAQFNGSRIAEGLAYDLGAEYAPLKLSAGGQASEFAVQIRYRYCRFGPVPASEGRPALGNANGFIFGIVGDVRF